jgi:hypothetical protein
MLLARISGQTTLYEEREGGGRESLAEGLMPFLELLRCILEGIPGTLSFHKVKAQTYY